MFFDDIPYTILSYDEQEDFFEKYKQELRGNTSNWRKYDVIELYNNQYDKDDNFTNLLDFVCRLKIIPSGYVILYIPEFDSNNNEILRYKQYFSLIPIDYNEYTKVKYDNIIVMNE